MNRIKGQKRRPVGLLKNVLMMILMLHSGLLLNDAVYGNNVRINGEPVVQLNSTSDSLSLTFTLSWDNSWRDDFNWDAVWLFVKYKREGSHDAWSHLYLGGSQVGTANLEIDPGNTGSQIVGAFVYPKHKGTFHIAGEQVRLQAPLNGLTAADITEGKIYFVVTGIEMVLIPYGAYYLGDGQSNRTFRSVPARIIPAESDIIGTDPTFSYSCIPAHYKNASPAAAANRQSNSVWTDLTNSIYLSNQTSSASWIVNFGLPRTIRTFGVSGASSHPVNYSPANDWYLLGSNDSLSWDTLWKGGPEYYIAEVISYPVRHAIRVTYPGVYQYYRIYVPSVVANDGAMMANVAMSEEDLYPEAINNLYLAGEKAIDLGKRGVNKIYVEDGSTWSGSLPAAYPKGYKGFYVMKYELSQEQYVNFLNMLSYAQQKSRIGNNLDNLKRGDYVFGAPAQPSCRNGIAVFSNKGTSQPVVFGNNLNPAEPFFAEDDGQTLACNYMTGADMLAYLDWSGLRPLSELEYEKMCRTPNRVTPGEYAWNSTVVHSLGGQSGLSSSTVGTENEVPSGLSTNVNSGVPSFGPVRCGSFGSSTSTQQESGSSFYGVMELSGNLGEMYYSVTGGSALNTSSSSNEYHGDGVIDNSGNYNVGSYWNRSSDASAFMVRGGSFASADSLLRVSDRSVVKGYDNTERDSMVTFRGGRSLSLVSGMDAGLIAVDFDTLCPGKNTIRSIQPATNTSGMAVTYLWYVKVPGASVYELVYGAGNENLNYDFLNPTESVQCYTFKRKALCALGEIESNELNIYSLPHPFRGVKQQINAGSSQVISLWSGEAGQHWQLSGAPAGTTINSQGIVNAVGTNGTTFQVFYEVDRCPNKTYTHAIEVKNEIIYSGAVDSVTLKPGTYKIECWGAAGGSYGQYGGNGGYVSGELTLTGMKRFYLYLGAKGINGGGSAYSFNGGGIPGAPYYASQGGGATDIRLIGGAWDDFNSQKSRIMVAGAGGGSDYWYSRGSGGGAAGGLTGYSGGYYSRGSSYFAVATGGTQIEGGTGGYGSGYGGFGGFGVGGSRDVGDHGGGGGSGYYGGGNGNFNNSVVGSGAGGSSFISGHPGCDAISGTSTLGSITHTGQPLHYSGIGFQHTVMIDGNGYEWTTSKGNYVGMPALEGMNTISGNPGNGQIRITPL